MNYIRHLNAFFSLVRNDKRLTSSHVSLYLALFYYWNFNRFKNPFAIYRENVLQVSKLSKNTYHKAIKELHEAKLIRHYPSLNKFNAVRIAIIPLTITDQPSVYKQLKLFPEKDESSGPKINTDPVPKLGHSSLKIETGTVPKLRHIINQTSQNIENSVCNTPTQIFEKNREINEKLNNLIDPNHPYDHTSLPSGGTKGGLPRGGRSREGFTAQPITSSPVISPLALSSRPSNQEHLTSSGTPCEGENCSQENDLVSNKTTHGMPSKKLQKPTPPTITMVEDFFKTNKYSLKEAQKFFYYNQGKNWMLTDKIPIQDWQSLAHKWMLNTKHTTKHTLPPPGGDTEGVSGGLSEAIQFLYDLYLQGTPISKQLQSEFANHLQLEITEKIMTEAIQRRINQLSGSNERSENQLWSAYMQEDFQNPIIQNDYPNLLSLAKRLAVLKHFQNLKSKGMNSIQNKKKDSSL